MILIDSFYFFLESKKYSQNGIDIQKLVDYLGNCGYKPKTRKWITSYNNEEVKPFYHLLKSYNGPQFEVIIKGTKTKRFICSNCSSENFATVEKGNDVAIATLIVHGALTNIYNTLLLVAGDGDFEPAVKVAKEAGKKIVLIGNRDTLSTDLQYLADDFIELSTISGIGK